MALNNDDQKRVRGFLLGQLDEDEQQRLEERLVVEDELFEELEISKSELVEEYAANELSDDEHQSFERNFLASPEGRERYAFTMALGHLQRGKVKPPKPLTFFERLKNLFKHHPSIIAAATATAGVVIVGAIFLSRPAGQTVVGPTLASNMMNRGQGSPPPKITVPANASELKFRLLLPRDWVASANYRAELDNRTDTKAVKVAEHDSEGVWVVVPASQLPRGAYSLRLVSIDNSQERRIPGDYLFIVE